MAIKMVRKPSDTPNINNIDDIVGLRYAYGNQNGYVKDKGNEISYSVNGSTFRINSGRLVLQGVEVDIDANGIDLTVDNFATKQFYSVYLTVNLGLNSVQIQTTVDTAGYPEIDLGDDLTKNTNGIARLELYRFTAQNGLISDIQKIIQEVKYFTETKAPEAEVSDNAKRINNIPITKNEKGILNIEGIIIPQKKILWENSEGITTNDNSLFAWVDIFTHEGLKNKKLCVVYAYWLDGVARTKLEVIVDYSNDDTDYDVSITPYVNFVIDPSGNTIAKPITFAIRVNSSNTLQVEYRGHEKITSAVTIYKVYEIIE